MSYDLAELQRKFAALVIFGTVSEVDHKAKKLRVTEGNLTSGWLPFPAETGRNYRRWRPIKLGQQLIVLCRAGDPNNGVIIGELYCESNDAPLTDENIDIIEFNDGAELRYDSKNKAMTIQSAGELNLIATRINMRKRG
jgi:phage baseplate assembly protein V